MSETKESLFDDPENVNIGILGASGLVGGLAADILAERNVAFGALRVFASEQSAGGQIQYKDRNVVVEDAAEADFTDLDIVIGAAGAEVSKRYAERITSGGAILIDNSSAFRMDRCVPLVVAGVNDEDLDTVKKGSIVANPNCTTAIALTALKPLHDKATLDSMTLTTFQAASGAGHAGVEALNHQMSTLMFSSSLTRLDGLSKAEVFPARIVDNVIPQRGEFADGKMGETEEEVKLREESRKILGLPHLRVSGTCVSVPVMNGHSISVNAKFKNQILPEQARTFLDDTPGVKVVDLPMPSEASGHDEVLVGRIRPDETAVNGLAMFVSGDNLRRGAALNAVQSVELLLDR
jgi:aspartate-semialdehyde dehydrogenase